jgi:hypothetical protein
MQVVNFYDNEKDLFNPKNNIEWEGKILLAIFRLI